MVKTVATNIVNKSQLRKAQLEALQIISKSLQNSFGPFGYNTIIRKSDSDKDVFGRTIYTKDGHTILKHVLMNRPIEMSVKEDLISITTDTVKKVGDGTTSAIILSEIIFRELVKISSEKNIPEVKIVKDFKSVCEKIIKSIDSKKRKCTLDDIYNIAFTSTNGNEEFSNAIRNIYEKYGMSVHIDVGISNNEDHVLKEYDGMSFDKGYYSEAFINDKDTNTSRINKPKIYVFEDPIDTPDIKRYFDKILYDNVQVPYEKNIPFVPTVIFSSGYGTDMKSASDEIIEFMLKMNPSSKPPLLSITNIHNMEALNDLCTLTGAKLIKKYNNPAIEKIDAEKGIAPTLDTIHNFAGSADLVIADASTSKVINPKYLYERDENGNIILDENNNPIFTEIYKSLVQMAEMKLKDLESTKSDITDIYLLEKRIGRLKGNMVEYLVGGVANSDRDSVKDLVEDAVLNCRSAASDGVGYGSNFEGLKAVVELSGNIDSDEDKDYWFGSDKYMVNCIFNAYIELATILYSTAFNNVSEDKIRDLISDSLSKGNPLDLRSFTNHDISNTSDIEKALDNGKNILSSINSDKVILNAISKVISVAFSSNQYLVQAPQYNIYEDDDSTVIAEA